MSDKPSPITATTTLVQKIELRHHIHRERPFLIPKPQLRSWEDLEEEKEQRQYTVAVIAGMIVATALWLWAVAIVAHWAGAQIWQHIGRTAWLHLLGGGLNIFLSARGMR